MNLIERDERGRLTPLCAARLVWSGILVIDPADVTFNGARHLYPTPAPDTGTASLWGLKGAEVQGLAEELAELLGFIEGDQGFCLDRASVSEIVLSLVPPGPITAGSIFLLQAAAHPLALEATGPDEVTVRYDEALAACLPDFSDLIGRLVFDLRSYQGTTGPFRLVFERLIRSVGALPKPTVAVTGACTHFETTRDVFLKPEIDARFCLTAQSEDVPHAETIQPDRAQLQALRDLVTLEGALLTCEEVTAYLDGQIASIKDKEARLAAAAPDARDPLYQTPDFERTFAANTRLARTFLFRCAVSIAIGLFLILIGRHLVTHAQDLGHEAAAQAAELIGNLIDAVDLFVGNIDAVGITHQVADVHLAGVLRTCGLGLMAIGIIVPTRRIIKLRRRLAKEGEWLKNNATLSATLAKHRSEDLARAFQEAAKSWQDELRKTEEELRRASVLKEDFLSLNTQLSAKLDGAYESAGLKRSCRGLVAATTLFDYLDQGRAQDLSAAVALFDEEGAQGTISLVASHATALQPTLASCLAQATATRTRLERRSSFSVAEKDLLSIQQELSNPSA